MAKLFKFAQSPQMKFFGLIAGAALSIPAIVASGFAISLLIRNIF